MTTMRPRRPLLVLAVLAPLGVVVFGAKPSSGLPPTENCIPVIGLCASGGQGCLAVRRPDGTPCDYANADSAFTGPCLTGGTCKAGVCVGQTPAVGVACDDKNACTYGDKCNSAGACVGTPVTCSNTTCAHATCNGTAQCTVQRLNEGGSCATDAGKPGSCIGGTCRPQAVKPPPPGKPPPKSELAPKG